MWAIFVNPMFYFALAALTFMGIAAKVPLVGDFFKTLGPKKKVAVLFAAAGIIVGGYLGTSALFGSGVPGQITPTSVSMVSLSSVSAKASGNCTVAVDTTRSDMITARCTDEGVVETAGIYEIEANFTLIRKDNPLAGFCPVTVSTAPYNSPSDTSDSNTYYVIERTNTRELEAYLSSTAGATDADAKEKLNIGFTEGAASATVGMVIEIDEEASDELNQYDKVLINVDFCGYPYTIEYMEMDAAA